MVNDWDLYFIEEAKLIATRSKDPSTKVGSVIVDKNKAIVSKGYNGFARGVGDYPDRYANRELKYKMIVHAERNAIIFAKRDLEGCTLYTWPFMPCAPCAAMVIQAGIKRVVAPECNRPDWQADFDLTHMMFSEAGVALDLFPIN